MNDGDNPHSASRRVPCNKGKLPGAKPPLRLSHVSIRTELQANRSTDARGFTISAGSPQTGLADAPPKTRAVLLHIASSLSRCATRYRRAVRSVHVSIASDIGLPLRA